MGALQDTISFSESIAKSIVLELTETLSINDSSLNTIELEISDLITLETLIDIDYTEGKSHKSDWQFLIKDNSGNKVASLTNARKRWIIERLDNQSEAGFILDADDDKCTDTILNLGVNELHIYYKGILKNYNLKKKTLLHYIGITFSHDRIKRLYYLRKY